MASSYSPLKVELIGTGEQAGTWGTTTNTNLGTTLEEAITGRATATFPSDADYTLPYIDSNSSQVFRNLVLNVTSSGNLSSTRNLIIPAIEKQYLIENNTSGSQSIVVKTAAGSGITVPNGRRAHVFCDGTTTRFADDFVDINGGAIDGTPIGASSASTGAFTTASITTATVTTGNITTGNINTLTVGTQTNKATISYTTNAARTLTVPAVGGNRTFAFLEEAQTFTAAQTYNANQTIAANLIFSGNARRIQGQFDNYDNNATIFQDAVTNGPTTINIAPNGTGGAAAVHCHSSSDIENSVVGAISVDSNEVAFFSVYSGTASYQTMYLVNGGIAYVQIDPNGSMCLGGAPTDANTSVLITAGGKSTALEVVGGTIKFPTQYSATVGATNRSLYIDNTGVIGGLTSTRESKKNITPISNVDWLMSLEPVSYNRRMKDSQGAYTEEVNPTTEFGLIADDVATVRPEVCVFVNGKVSGINYEHLIAPMLKEIQNLRAEIAALKEKVNG